MIREQKSYGAVAASSSFVWFNDTSIFVHSHSVLASQPLLGGDPLFSNLRIT